MASDETTSLGQETKVGKLARIERNTRIKANETEKRSIANAKKITMLKNILGYKDKESIGDKLPGGTKDQQSEQYRSINKNLMSVNRNLIAIAELITKGAQQEKKDDDREIKSKRREADAAKKGDKENFIESALKKSLIKPIEAAKKKVGGPFDRLMKAMEALFMTWIGIKGLDALKAWEEGDNVKLEEIKNNVIKGLAIAGGIALALNGGIALVIGAIKGVIGALLVGVPKLIGIMATPLALKALLLLGGVGLAVAAGLAAVKGVEYGAKRIMYGEDFFIGAQDAATDRLIKAGLSTKGSVTERRGSRVFSTNKARTEEQEKIFQEVQAERERLGKLRNQYQKAISDLETQYNTLKDKIRAENSESVRNGRDTRLTPKGRQMLEAAEQEFNAAREGLAVEFSGIVKEGGTSNRPMRPPNLYERIDAWSIRTFGGGNKEETGVEPTTPAIEQPTKEEPNQHSHIPQAETSAEGQRASVDMSSAVRESQATVRADALKTAETLNASTEESPTILVNPVAQENTVEESPATDAVGTGYPTDIQTQNPFNKFIDFAVLTYGGVA
mgnify:FL=1|jgi:hypothetical protein